MIYLPQKLIEKFLKRDRKPKVYDYELTDIHQYEGTDETHVGIKIVSGPYKGLLYFYKRVQFIEDKENDRCHVQFEWVPIENGPDHDTQDLYDVLGDILTDFIDKNDGNTAI